MTLSKDFIVQERRTIEYYFDANGNITEENDQIPSEFVVRCNLADENNPPIWEDQADFETLEEAEQFIADIEELSSLPKVRKNEV